ncbi:MAG: 2-oxo acid dehydrogenase subunit E2 [Alphaproteobacteria bacterium]|nr:2-oxo acid dehydrogenase subunit E2 [Alphaproteobacteria bacterium]
MVYSLKAPQIGEAVHSVNIIRYLKSVGESVKVDEPVVTLETHKTAVDIESPVAGIIKELLFPEGTSVPVGETIVLLLRDSDQNPKNLQALPPNIPHPTKDGYQPVSDVAALRVWLGKKRNAEISPRQKAYCLNNKVVPLSLYRSMMGDAAGREPPAPDARNESDHFVDVPLKKSQLILGQTLSDSARQVVSANVQMLCDNLPLENFRKLSRQRDASQVPSRLELIAWAVVCALKEYPAFCARVLNTTTMRQFKNPNIGIALALPDDGLTTAVVKNVFSDEFSGFARKVKASLLAAKDPDYVTGYHCMSISDMSSYGAINAIPVIAAPATATLFIGKPHLKEENRHLFYLSLSFDHRIINGVGATTFLRSVCNHLTQISPA